MKNLTIAVLTGHSPEYLPLAEQTIYRNKLDYCKRHGYCLVLHNIVSPKFQDPGSHASGYSWSRLEALAELVESGIYDWVWTVGCDTLITNFNISLEEIIGTAETPEAQSKKLQPCPYFPNSPAPHPVISWKAPANHVWSGRKHLIIAGERVTSMQADSFFVRGSKEGAHYVRDILSHYNQYKHHVWVENQTMIDLRDKHAAITHMAPQWMINCVDYSRWYALRREYRDHTDCYGNRGQWRRGDFLIHWPSSSLQQRLVWAHQYGQQIIQ